MRIRSRVALTALSFALFTYPAIADQLSSDTNTGATIDSRAKESPSANSTVSGRAVTEIAPVDVKEPVPRRVAALPADGILVTYPHHNSKINSASTYFIGAVDPGRKLTINGAPVRQSKEGFYAAVVKLNRGDNDFTLATDDGWKKTVRVIRPLPEKPMDPTVLAIKQGSMEPSVEQGVTAGDIIVFKVRATPGGEVTVKFGSKSIILSPAPDVRRARSTAANKLASAKRGKAAGSKVGRGSSKPPAASRSATSGAHAGKSANGRTAAANAPAQAAASSKAAPPFVAPSVNQGLAAAYGKVFQSLPAGADDLYVGFYKVQPTDSMVKAPVRFILEKNGKTITADSSATVTVIEQPYLVQTIKDDTVVRTEPGKARLTSLAQGVRLIVDGWHGTALRCAYLPNKHVWVEGPDVAYERGSPRVSGPPVKSYVQAINSGRDRYGDSVSIPLSQRLPYEIEQQVKPNYLTLRIYGATADTDWASQQYKPAFEEGDEGGEGADSTPGGGGGSSGGSGSSGSSSGGSTTSGSVATTDTQQIESITWKQPADSVYEVNIRLKGHRQWGYFATYNGTTLVLHIKRPLTLQNTDTGKLHGLTICVDPGHGGFQPGAIGCSGVSEATINLAISQKLRALLEAEGARVVMTRMTDVDLDLNQRVELAKSAGADILLSVHNNSLPDGRNPLTEHGSSTYWYHPQSTEFARYLDDALVETLGFGDVGARYQNLALTRPTHMLAVLNEVGFMINPDEYAQLIQPAVQEKAARAIVTGLKRYLGGKSTTPSSKK